MTAPSEIEAWLAREVCSAVVLAPAARGDLASARSAITSSALTRSSGHERITVDGKDVHYRCSCPSRSGTVPVRRLVEIAASLVTEAKHQALRAAQRAYSDECVTGRAVVYSPDLDAGQYAAWRAHQQRYRERSDALRLAVARWWLDLPEDRFAAGLDALLAARTGAQVVEAWEGFHDVWANEHEALARLLQRRFLDDLNTRSEVAA